MRSTPPSSTPAPASTRLATYPFHIAIWVDDAGYPVSVAVEASIDPRSLDRDLRAARRSGRPDRPRRIADRIAHPATTRLRLRRAAARDGLGPRVARIRPTRWRAS